MRKADNLPPYCAVVTKSGNLNFLETSGPVQAFNGTTLPFCHDPTPHFLKIHHNIMILSTHLRLGPTKWSLSLRFPHQNPVYTSPVPPYVPHALPLQFFSTNHIPIRCWNLRRLGANVMALQNVSLFTVFVNRAFQHGDMAASLTSKCSSTDINLLAPELFFF